MVFSVLGVAGVMVSAYVWYKQVTSGPVLCLGSGCAEVIRSRYGRLMGIPNGALGVAYFVSVVLIPLLDAYIPDLRPLAVLVTSLALVLYLYLTYLQFFVLRALCTWCLTSAGLTAAIFVTFLLT